MSATTSSTEGESPQPETGGAAGIATGSAVSLGGASTTQRCAVCSAELAGDQRYCVECGTRRGNPRFTLATGSSRPVSAVATQPEFGVAPRLLALLSLIVVLLALGIGVLIGNSRSSTSSFKGPVTVVLSGSSATAPTGSSGGGKTKTTAKTTKPPKAPTSFHFGGS
jgi:hypothetical protein